MHARTPMNISKNSTTHHKIFFSFSFRISIDLETGSTTTWTQYYWNTEYYYFFGFVIQYVEIVLRSTCD
jgi:hypothetical protein